MSKLKQGAITTTRPGCLQPGDIVRISGWGLVEETVGVVMKVAAPTRVYLTPNSRWYWRLWAWFVRWCL